MAIPKIIHHIVSADRSRWHLIWNRCYHTWKQHFVPDLGITDTNIHYG